MSISSTRCFILISNQPIRFQVNQQFYNHIKHKQLVITVCKPAMQQYKPINTFTMKPSVAQIVAYALFSLQIVTFYAIIQPRYQSLIISICMHVIYGLSLLVQLVSTLVCSLIDPSDRIMIQLRNKPQSREDLNPMQMLYCDLCQSHVQLSSKHCRLCGRCCSGFDHHCMWINNCISQHNYGWFIVMIASVFVTISTYLVAVCLLWGQGAWQSFLSEMIVIWIAFFIMICMLITFHVYLNCKGITTYSYIALQRQKQKVQIEKQRQFNQTEFTFQARDKHQTNLSTPKQSHPGPMNNQEKKQPVARETNKAKQTYGSDKHPKIPHYSSSVNFQKMFVSSRSLELVVGASAVQPAQPSHQLELTSIESQNKKWASVPQKNKSIKTQIYYDI